MRKSVSAAGAAVLLATAGAAQAQVTSGFWLGAEGAYEDYGNGLDDVSAGVAVGYDYVIGDQWLIGGAVRGTIEGLDKTVEATNGGQFLRTRTENDDEFGVSARIGRVFASRWVAYAQVEYDRFDRLVTLTRNAEVCAPPSGNCFVSTESRSKEKLWSGGVGLEYGPTQNLRLRAAYSYGERGEQERDRVGLTVAWKF